MIFCTFFQQFPCLTGINTINYSKHLSSSSFYKNKLNIILFDGEQTYLHTNYKDSLYVNQTDDGAIFSTNPLSEGTWDHLPFKTLVSYKDGEPYLSGREHEGEYIPDEQAIRALYLAYAGL